LSESFYEKSQQLGTDFLSLRERVQSEQALETKEVENTIKKLEKKLHKVPEKSVLHTRIQEQIERLRKQGEETRGLKRNFTKTKDQLLELTANLFEIDPNGDKKLSQVYIRALTSILLGKERTQLEFHECVVSSNNIDIVEDKIRALMISANVCEFIQQAAREKLGQESIVAELWSRIAKNKQMFKVYSTLAASGKIMNAREVSSAIGEKEWNRVKAKDNLKTLLREDLFEHKLIRRVEKGKYQVSDVGRFLWSEYALTKTENISDKEEDSQVALNIWTRS